MSLPPRRALAAIAAAIAVAIAGCTSTPGEPSADGSPSPSKPQAEDWQAGMVQCLTDKGWDVTSRDDGGFGYELSEEQLDPFDQAREECHLSLGYDFEPPEYSQDEAAEIYDAFVTAAECVRDLGYEVPDPPSKQAFVEEMVSGDLPSWNPYNGVVGLSDDIAWRRTERECPIEIP